jgi:hypothetical protein
MRTYGKLREKIREVFGTIQVFADAIGMSKSALSHKLNGKNAWKHSEIENACKLLGIPMEQVCEYFFYT